MWFSRIIGLVLFSVVIVSATRRSTRMATEPDFSVNAHPPQVNDNDNSNYYGARKKKTAAAKPTTKRKGRRGSNMDNMDEHHQPSIAQKERRNLGGYVKAAASKVIHKIGDRVERIIANGARVLHLPRRSHLSRKTSQQDAVVAHGRSGENARINEQAPPHATPIAKQKGKTKGKGKGKKKNTLVGLERQDRSMAFPIESIYKNKVFDHDACDVDINRQLGADPQPLYSYPNGDFVEIKDLDGHFYVERKSKINVFCEHGFRNRPGHLVEATCMRADIFMVNNKQIPIGSINCQQRMLGETKRITDAREACLNGNGEMAEIGFPISGYWKPLFEVCHNPSRASSEWTHYVIDPTTIGFQKSFTRLDMEFSEGESGFYADIDGKVDSLYTKNSQRKTFAKILPGGERSAHKLVLLEGTQYLARGHLTAKADLIFGAHQLATFFYINVAPQWQSFNGGNWRILEEQLKKFIGLLGHRAEVYTGTHGVMKHEGVELFLYIDEETGAKKLPVPRIYYKIVLVRSLKQAIVIVGINNPIVTDVELRGEYYYCDDISSRLNILHLANQYNKPSGYIIACTIQDFFRNTRMKNDAPHIENLHLKELGVLGLK